jgi:pimeloyl-ACP methyl ester carboxylesterase
VSWPTRAWRPTDVAAVAGVRSHVVATGRLRMHVLEAGPLDGIPVVLLHGNLSTGRFYEHLMAGAPAGYRLIAPDMRGFGDYAGSGGGTASTATGRGSSS